MRQCDGLRSAEVLEAFALIADCGPAAVPPAAIMDGLPERLARLFRSQICVLGEIPDRVDEGPIGWRPLGEFGWASHHQRLTMFSSMEQRESTDPCLLAILQRSGQCITQGRAEVVPDEAWFQSRYVRQHRSLAGLGDEAVSIWSGGVSAGWKGALVLHRRVEEPAFDAATLGLLHIVHRQLAPFIWGAALIPPLTAGPGPAISLDVKPVASLKRLTKAQQRLVPYLLRGLREEQIAALLCRSPHTIHDHVMAIYKACGVHSRADLIVHLNLHRVEVSAAAYVGSEAAPGNIRPQS